ncbi:transglycosylase domain-containing protein [Cohnella yongneupensis]|uniref:Transglycosylase domain-containing protein n=1 Tax=Cohnella yongneupensis TaxID=425006 RepID=A0ABW0R509_9BACL
MSDTKQHAPPSGRKARGFATAGKIAGMTFAWLLFFCLLGGLVAAGAVTGYIASLVKDDPVRARSLIEEKISENAITGYVYFNDGTPVGQLRTEEDRTPITYDQIPQNIIDAVISIEDKNFFTHNGIDSNGLFRAVKQQLLNESVQTGGSTITQQVARRVFLSLDQTSSRKAKEIFLSMRLERFLSKEEILTAYLNKIPYGNGSSGYQLYGIKAAAKGIFGVDKLDNLNVAQAAYLAGVPQLPSVYSAFTGKGEFNEKNFKRAVERQKLVLKRMLEESKLTQAEYEEALNFDLYSSLAKPTEKAYNTYPYLMLEAERQAAEQLVLMQNPELTTEDLKKKENAVLIEDARGQLLRGGYKVKTTIDKKVYDLMHQIAENPDNFAPDHKTKGVEQVASVMIDQKTGAILGMIEGRDFHIEQMNYATQMTRQPGSAMKPIAAYWPALDRGLIQPASIIDDSPIILDTGTGSYHVPKNFNDKYSGLVTARDALNNSFNIPAIKIFLNKLTIKESWDFVRSVGITTLTETDNTAQTGVIGGLKYGVTVEELTNAYAAIANKGVYNDSYLIEEIRDANDEIVFKHKLDPTRVTSEQAAYQMTDMLRTVVSDGSGKSLKTQFKGYGKIPIVGKTGTTQIAGDVWFEGYSPDVTLGVWIGYEKATNALSKESRTRARLIWADIMNAVMASKPELLATKSFDKPDGLVSMTVSSVSGKLPTDLTKEAGKLVTDIFNRKFIPTEEDDALVKVKYISYNGINYLPLPTTPDDLLRESVMVKREVPLDALMEELKVKLEKTDKATRKPLPYYLPQDAAESAPSKTDPRVDDGIAPNAVAQIAVETVAAGTVQVTFTPSMQEDVAGYRLYRSMDGGPYLKVEASVPTGEEPKFINYISQGSTYSYYVTAVDVAGNESAPSEQLTSDGTVSDIDPTLPPDETDPGDVTQPGDIDIGDGTDPTVAVPKAPAGLAVQGTALTVTLTWNANPADDHVVQYQVWSSATSDGKFKLAGTTDGTSWEFVSPLPNSWYYVTAINETGVSSAPSSVVQATSE